MDLLHSLYMRTKGYKTLIGFAVSFISGGLVWTHVIDMETGKKIVEFGALLIAFGLGDKAAALMNE